MKKAFTFKILMAFLFLVTVVKTGFSQASITNTTTPITQNFNSLAQSGTTNTWTDNTTLPGWYANRVVYIADAGTSTTGAMYSYGTTATSERALGALTSGTTPTVQFAIRLVNNTGNTIDGLNISYRGEQWRQNTTAQLLVFESQVGATSLSTGTWVANTAFNFTAPKTGAAGALDGNAAGNFTNITGALPLTILNGQEVWLRWTKTGSTSPGIAIDDVSITATAALSTNADLSNLVLSAGTLTPNFASATTNYTSSVGNATNSITLTPTSSNNNATITVNGVAVNSGAASTPIALNVGPNTITTIVTAQDGVTKKTYTTVVTRANAGAPNLSITAPLAAFGSVCINNTVGPNSFVLSGTDLDGTNINIAAITGYTFCETSNGTFTPTLNFSYSAPTISNKNIFVKFTPTLVQSFDGAINLSGGGVASFPVSVTGSGINTNATIITGGSSNITATTATLAGSISGTACAPTTAYGIEYSTTTGFANGSGIAIVSTNLSGSNFTALAIGLLPNTRYYYKAYVTNANGTTYGNELFFTNTPLPVPMALQPGLMFTETFSDIANWTNFFVSGTGANHWDGLSASTTSPAAGIPNPTITTASTNSFQTPSGLPPVASANGGVHKGTDQSPASQSIVLLSTGSTSGALTNNFSAAAIDFYVDFTGVNAGTLSFDYTTINNSAGDRPGSLRVYYSVDGVTFTELTNLLNFTNNTPLSGSKQNVPLPAVLNNNANARFRFYYYNGETGGTTGARPKLSIDNLKIASVANTPCVAPTVAPTTLNFTSITDVSMQGNFTAANPTADSYITVISTTSTLTGAPVDGQIYNLGDNLGDGTVISNSNTTSFVATGLSPLTTYYFFVFSVNNVCTGGPLYFSTALEGNSKTIAGLPACVAPIAQATNLILSGATINSIQGEFSATTADNYLVLRSSSSTLSSLPVNTQNYNAGDVIGNATVVQRNNLNTFVANNLMPATPYYFYIFSLNGLPSCVNGPIYNNTNSLTGNLTTIPLPLCTTPSAQPINLILTASSNSIAGNFLASSGTDNYLVVKSLLPTLSATPIDNVNYTIGDNLGGGSIVSNSGNNSFVATGLAANTTYYFFVFASNKNCSAGPKYNTSNALSGNIVTSNLIANNFYFGNLHAHSDYSDGNTDNPGFTPALDYEDALTAQCMDYLGISEHNHFSAEALLSNYRMGVTQANNFTASHPNFLALYGMEWGTIGTGGHVLIYGNGMDNLWGWESGSGNWGPTNNYDVYVPKGTYVGNNGVFKITNDNIATNTFISLAHPSQGDFNNLDAIAYDVVADDAITACAIESGPSTSSSTTYSTPGFSLGFYGYFQTLLAKGYHLGPTIDHDNHKTTFGKTTYSRTVIVAPVLTKAAIVNAMKNMNFYATQDCDTKVDFSINTKILGSIFTDKFAPNIFVKLTDATTSVNNAVIRVMYGVPGSGVLPVKIDSIIGSTLNFADVNLANLATGYYFIDITNGNSRIVTSPIWYTRNDGAAVLPTKLGLLSVSKINNAAKINWVTEQEINTKQFIIERSADGSLFTQVANVAAAGNSSQKINYEVYDSRPLNGINYYRVKQMDVDGKFEYSIIKSVLFKNNYSVQISPNPAKDFVSIYFEQNNNSNKKIQLVNTAGKIIYTKSTTENRVLINTSNLSKGLYFIKVIEEGFVKTNKIIIE
jgi:trimeric autotransporter adhesin